MGIKKLLADAIVARIKAFVLRKRKIFLVSRGTIFSLVGGATSVFWQFAKMLAAHDYDVTCLFDAEDADVFSIPHPPPPKSYKYANDSTTIFVRYLQGSILPPIFH